MIRHRFVLLDGLRGLAAVGVVLTHVASKQFHVLSGLYLLVDFFFVLSGFVLEPLMPQANQRFWPQARRFIYKRFLRFWPMVIVVLSFRVGTCATWSLLNKPSEHYCGALPSGGDRFSLLAAALLLQVVVPSALVFGGPLWSLSAEWFTNILVTPLTPMRNRFVLPTALIVGYGLLGIGYLRSSSTEDLFIGYASIGRALLGFVLGLMCRRLFTNRNPQPSTQLLVLSLLLVVGLFVYQRTPYPGALLLAAPIFTFFVFQVARVNQFEIAEWLISVARYLGLISFGVYAWHGNIRFFMATFQSEASLKPYAVHSTTEVVILTLEVLLGSALATHLTIRYVEMPIQQRWGRRYSSSGQAVDSSSQSGEGMQS